MGCPGAVQGSREFIRNTTTPTTERASLLLTGVVAAVSKHALDVVEVLLLLGGQLTCATTTIQYLKRNPHLPPVAISIQQRAQRQGKGTQTGGALACCFVLTIAVIHAHTKALPGHILVALPDLIADLQVIH